MFVRNSYSITADLNYDELGVIYRALDSYGCNITNHDEYQRVNSLKSDIYNFIHKS